MVREFCALNSHRKSVFQVQDWGDGVRKMTECHSVPELSMRDLVQQLSMLAAPAGDWSLVPNGWLTTAWKLTVYLQEI